MDARRKRGLELARVGKLRQKGEMWIVPSQTHCGTYLVEPGERPTCTCPDFELTQKPCKHVFAVEFTVQKVTAPDGTVTETKTVRVTYRQDWPAYNAAQVHEAERFTELLADLCSGIMEEPRRGRGRPRIPLRDAVASAVLKVYSTMSGRRASGDVRSAREDGYLTHAPHYNSVFRTLEDESLTPLLKTLIEESAAPLRAVERDFAVDASGFTTCSYARWFDAKYGREMKAHTWWKVHLMCGVRTNVVTGVEITNGDVHDYHLLPTLVQTTAKRFELAEVSADKGYIGRSNLDAIAATGAAPYIPFKAGAKDIPKHALWSKLWHYYGAHREEFLAHYHKRSNVESTFSMVKAKFGAAVRSKTPVAQQNEILAKILCHNLCCLVSSIYELGLEPAFWREAEAA